MSNEEQRWRVPVRGELSHQAISRLDAAQIRRSGASGAFSSGGVEVQASHALLVRAPSAEAAAAKVKAAVEGFPVFIAEDEIKPFDS